MLFQDESPTTSLEKELLKLFLDYENVCVYWEKLNLTPSDQFLLGKAEGIREVIKEAKKILQKDKEPGD